MTRVRDIAWAAGFLEGEGSFQANARSQLTVNAVQVNKEPLDRMLGIFGGSVRQYVNNHDTKFWRWAIHGAKAIGVAFTLFTCLSEKRRDEVRHMVAKWKAAPGHHNLTKIHCPQGHPYDEENTRKYFSQGGWRRDCRECNRERTETYRRLKEE